LPPRCLRRRAATPCRHGAAVRRQGIADLLSSFDARSGFEGNRSCTSQAFRRDSGVHRAQARERSINDVIAGLAIRSARSDGAADRRARRIVATAAVLLAVAALAWASGLGSQRGVASWEPAYFAASGALLLVITLAVARSWIAAPRASAATVILLAALITERLVMLHLGDAYADPHSDIFLPAHATMPVLALLCVVLQPFPRSIRLAIGFWLMQAGIVTVTLWPFLGEAQPRPYLHGTLLYVWLVMAIFLSLLGMWAREQQRLVLAHAAAAEEAEAASEQQARSEAQLRLIFDQGTAGIGLIDADARWLDVNGQLAAMLGYRREELLGRPLCELLPADSRDERRAHMQAFLTGTDGAADAQLGEGVWLHRDGHPVWLSQHLRRIDADVALSARAVLIAIDVTARVQAENEAAEGKRHEAFQFEHVPLALIEWDQQMRVRRWSKQAETLLGWPAADVVGRSLREASVLEGAEADEHEAAMGEILSGERAKAESLHRTQRLDGSHAWVRWTHHSLAVADGRPGFLLSTGTDVTELLDNNIRLAESRRELRAIFDQSAVGIALLDGDGRWLTVNHRICEILGRSEEQLLETDFQSITHPDDLSADLELAEDVIAGRSSGYSMEKRYLLPDGGVVYARLHVRRIEATTSSPVRFVSVVEDITERRRIELETHELKRVRELHFDQTPLAVIEWDPAFRVRRWSRRAEAIFGWREDEVLGKGPLDWPFIHEQDIAYATQVMSEIHGSRGHTVHARVRHRHCDGRVMWCQWHTSAVLAADGSVVAFHSLGDDITAEHETQLALAAAEARFRVLFDQVAAGIGRFDADGRWIEVNPKLAELHNSTPEAMLGTRLVDDALPSEQPLVAARLTRLFAGETDDYTVERPVRCADGSTRWLMSYLRRVQGPDGRPQGVLVSLDISARKAAEAAAEEHQKVRDFHFDNTPLAVIEWTPDLKVRRWSRTAEAMFGWTADDVMGRNPQDWPFIHEDDQARVAVTIHDLVTLGRSRVEMTNRNYTKDGRVLWCHWFNSALRDPSGQLLSLFSMVDDVTEDQLAREALNDSEARFRGLFEQAGVGIAILDGDGGWLQVNARFAEIVGRSRTDLMLISCEELTLEADRLRESGLRARLLRGEIDDYTIEKRYRLPYGEPVWVSLFARRLDPVTGGDADRTRLSLAVVDISERKAAEAKVARLTADLERRVAERTAQLEETLREAAARNDELRLLAELMSLLPATGDIGEAQRIVASYLPRLFRRCNGTVWMVGDDRQRYVRQAWWTTGGLAACGSADAGCSTHGCNHQCLSSIVTEDCWSLRRGQPLRIDDPNHPLKCRHLGDGPQAREPHACVPIHALGQPIGLISLVWSERPGSDSLPPDPNVLTSAAEQIGLAIGSVLLREELRRQAVRDPLTGLYNRRHFDETLHARIADHERHGHRFALLAIDIDHFKRINDSHGHDVGDRVLREVGALLGRAVRAEEAAFRPGGEEFALLIDDGADGDALGCAERIRAAVETLHTQVAGDEAIPPVTVSIGVARYPVDLLPGSTLLQRADGALYAAKRTGRNRVCAAGVVTGREQLAVVAG
jgi:diguanylate cyclase (GGDEF)-like protein/PAS domain S-box-containing protein